MVREWSIRKAQPYKVTTRPRAFGHPLARREYEAHGLPSHDFDHSVGSLAEACTVTRRGGGGRLPRLARSIRARGWRGSWFARRGSACSISGHACRAPSVGRSRLYREADLHADEERAMSDVRRRQSGDGRDPQDVRDDHRRRAQGRDRAGARRARRMGPRHDRRGARRRSSARVAELHNERQRGARRDHRARDGQADRAGASARSSSARRSTSTTPTTRAKLMADEPIELLEGDGSAFIRRSSVGAAARDHAVELPLLPGGPLRRPEPGDRQHDPAQARAAVPGVGRGDGGDLPRGRRPAGRLHQHLRDQRPDRVGHRRPARAGRVADRLAAARAPRSPRSPGATSRRSCSSSAARTRSSCSKTDDLDAVVEAAVGARLENTRPGLQRGQALHRARRALRRVRGEVHRGADRRRAGRPDVAGHDGRPAVLDGGGGPARGAGQAGARQRRATLVAGGGRDGNFFKTAVLTDITPDNPAYTEEFFGPGRAGLQGRLGGRGDRAGQRHAVRPRLLRVHRPTTSRRCASPTRSRPAWCSSTRSAPRAPSCRSAA